MSSVITEKFSTPFPSVILSLFCCRSSVPIFALLHVFRLHVGLPTCALTQTRSRSHTPCTDIAHKQTHTHRDTDTRTDTEACTGHRSPVVSGWWQVNSPKQHFARQAQQVRIRTSPHVSGFVGNDPTDFVTAPFLRLCL